MDKAKYYDSAENVLHTFSPMSRFLSKFLPKDWFVIKCKGCNKIPTEVISSFDEIKLKTTYHCLDCVPKIPTEKDIQKKINKNRDLIDRLVQSDLSPMDKSRMIKQLSKRNEGLINDLNYIKYAR